MVLDAELDEEEPKRHTGQGAEISRGLSLTAHICLSRVPAARALAISPWMSPISASPHQGVTGTLVCGGQLQGLVSWGMGALCPAWLPASTPTCANITPGSREPYREDHSWRDRTSPAHMLPRPCPSHSRPRDPSPQLLLPQTPSILILTLAQNSPLPEQFLQGFSVPLHPPPSLSRVPQDTRAGA